MWSGGNELEEFEDGRGSTSGGNPKASPGHQTLSQQEDTPGGRCGFAFSTEEKEAPEISEGSGRVFHYTVSSIRAELALFLFISATSLVQSTGPGVYFENSFNTCE